MTGDNHHISDFVHQLVMLILIAAAVALGMALR